MNHFYDMLFTTKLTTICFNAISFSVFLFPALVCFTMMARAQQAVAVVMLRGTTLWPLPLTSLTKKTWTIASHSPHAP